MADNRIKLVVYKNHSLGYIFPERSKEVQILHANVLKGAPFGLEGSSAMIFNDDDVRLASAKDFDEYKVQFLSDNGKGFNNKKEYHFAE